MSYIYIFLVSFIFSSTYNVGDQISIAHQNAEYDICYGSELDLNGDGVFQLVELNGDLNGGNYYVTLLKMSTSWWPACYSGLSSLDSFIQQYSNNENVFIFTSLGDIGQPYSCYQWGSQGVSGMPLITDDTGLPLFNLFNTENLLPSVVLIDHNMKV